MKLTLRIWRQQDAKTSGHFETYQLADVSPHASFLEMLDAEMAAAGLFAV